MPHRPAEGISSRDFVNTPIVGCVGFQCPGMEAVFFLLYLKWRIARGTKVYQVQIDVTRSNPAERSTVRRNPVRSIPRSWQGDERQHRRHCSFRIPLACKCPFRVDLFRFWRSFGFRKVIPEPIVVPSLTMAVEEIMARSPNPRS